MLDGKQPAEWVRIAEELERIYKSEAFQLVLEEVESDLVRDWIKTTPGPEGVSEREAIHAQIAVLTEGIERAFQGIINKGEYARNVIESQKDEF